MSSLATRLADGMRISVTLLPLTIGVAISSRVAVATLQRGHTFIAWQLLWWLFASAVLGIITFHVARTVMRGITSENANLCLEVLGLLGGPVLLIVGLSASIIIIISGHAASAPAPFYWPLPMGSCLLVVGERAYAHKTPAKEIIRRPTDEEETRRRQIIRWRNATDQQKEEWEEEFLEVLYSVADGGTGSVPLGAVWPRLSYEFWPEAIAGALRVWHGRKWIDVKSDSYLGNSFSYVMDNYLTLRNPSSYKWSPISISLTDDGWNLCRLAKRSGVSMSETYYNTQEGKMREGISAGQIIGPVTYFKNVGGSVTLDQYDRTWRDLQNCDTESLAMELARLRAELEVQATDDRYKYADAAIRAAQLAAQGDDGPAALSHLARVGKWVLPVATKIGTTVAAAAIKAAMGV